MKKKILLVLFLSAVLGYGFIFQKNALRDFKDSIVDMSPEEGKSLSQRNNTSMFYLNPADLNYIEDFEGTHGWEFTNGTQVNKWYVGTAVNNGGTKSLYISNNNGTANTYTITTTSVTQAYKQIAIPVNTSDVQIGFDWRADGEGSSILYDYFRVWVVPETFTPTPGTQIAAGGGRVQVGGSFNLNPSWTTYNGVVNLSAFAGQNVRLVFEWRNDGSAGTQPPVAIDNVVVKGVTCSSPSNLVLTAIDATSAQLSWSAPITANVASYDYYYSTSPTAPTTPSGNTTATTVTIEGLNVYTQYYFWVRTNCGTTDGSSFWTGPIQITTTQNPAPVDFTEGFEGDTSGWTFTNGNQTNKWIIGTAVANGGTKSLYITNNNGTSNAYTTSSSTTTHAIRDLAFPVNASEATLSFDWRAVGEGTSFVYDYFKVWLVPVTYNPVPGTLIADDVEGAVQIGGTFNQQGTWQSYSQLLDVNAYAGQSRRLIFEWRNDSSGGTQPPAAIDNVEMKLITCPRPINIQVQKNNQGNMVITWQPTGTETQWEIIIQPATDPPPTDATTGIVVNGTPQYIYTQGQQGVIYNVYIRAVCGDADKSLWTDPVQFSDFNPPACADLDVSPLDLNVNENGEYIFCEAEGEVTINLDAQFDTSFFKSTTEYTVESIDYDPPFPFTGGTPMNVSIDDTWSPVINLPFSVCFYDNHFTKAQVGSNGMVVFGTNYTPNVGGSAPYSMTGYTSFPDPQYLALGNGARLKNCILGVYQDIDPSITNSGSTPNINYQVLGTYPCRALVVNFNDVDLYSNFNGCATSNPGQYYQIVIYEITNIIEVYVGNRNSCAAFNDGKGVIGLINEDHTAGTFPPNRNIGTWTAQQEAWRFRPNGETSVTFGWYANGELISTDPQHAITISETTHFEARISYPGCGDEDFEIVKDFTVKVSEEVIATKAEDIELCVFQGEIPEVNLRDKDAEVLAQIENTTNFEVNYYETFNGADTDTGRIPTPENYQPDMLPKTIYVRVENTDTECYATTSFNIVPKEAIKITKPDDIIVCVYDGIIPNVDLHQAETKLMSQIPDLNNHVITYHNSQNEAVLNQNPILNANNYQADGLPKTIYVRVSNISTQCEAVTNFRIIAGNFLDPYSIDDVLICTNYVLPALPNNYYYSTEQTGKGTLIAAGTVYGLGQHTLYINIDSENGCVTSTQFNFEVVPCTVTKGISPNGDGLNDNFDLTLYHPLQVVIYNRDGREVYIHGPGYTNQWYGQDKNGKELPDGTYFYKITTATEVLSGYVQVLREIK